MDTGSGIQSGAGGRRPTYRKGPIFNHFNKMVRGIVADVLAIIGLSSKSLIISLTTFLRSQRLILLKGN
jgi:hypothetical protein